MCTFKNIDYSMSMLFSTCTWALEVFFSTFKSTKFFILLEILVYKHICIIHIVLSKKEVLPVILHKHVDLDMDLGPRGGLYWL